ncbi:hypothetical protein LBMAG42_13710 [Deltaproteobacteria bacterium]|nr:hypothetical protein LBMAG42_13710 [Deltaproteobacteria bacterium]
MRAIGPWNIVGTLGQGAMGVVYRAVHRQGGPQVALKTCRGGTPEETARIRSEIHALSGIHHPGVVRLLADGATDGVPWYAMELLGGGTLRDFCADLWPTDPFAAAEPHAPPTPAPPVASGRLREVLTLFARLCAPLAAIHGRGLVHRDLKPENVFLRNGDDPVLMDLGLVAQARGAVGRERIDACGRVLGTVAYMAPEQAEGLIVDARADLYALGAMLYEALTGRRTIQVQCGMMEQLNAVRGVTPPRPSELAADVPPALDDLVMSLLAKSPSARIGHALDVQRVLVSCGAEGVHPPTAEVTCLYRPRVRGRPESVTALLAAVDALAEGTGGLVGIAGESGSGKTLLASEAAAHAGRRGLGVIAGECLPVEAGADRSGDFVGAPLHPFRKFLQACGDRARHLGNTPAARRLTAHARVLALYEPSLASTPGYDDLPVPGSVAPAVARDRVVTAVRETLAAWVDVEGPLFLVLDDVQWMDELSAAVLRSFDAKLLASVPLLVLVTWRSDETGPRHETLASLPPGLRLRLDRLDRTAVSELVGDMLAMSVAPGELIDLMVRETEGNPFFVAEYLRMAAAEGLLVRESGRWVLSGDKQAHHLPAPGSLTELISRRIGGLAPAAATVLDVAAVLGRFVDRETLELALGEPIGAGMAELEQRQVLEVAEGGWRFVHDKLREAAMSRMAPERRRALHQAAAAAIETRCGAAPDDAFAWAALASHWEGAGDAPRAARAWGRAGDQAGRNFSHREAKETYSKALAHATAAGASDLERSRWEAGLADACILSGETRRGMAHQARALAAVGFPLPQTPAAWALGFTWRIVVRFLQAYVPGAFRVSDPLAAERITLAANGCSRLLEPYFLANLPINGCYVGLNAINLAERTGAIGPLARGLGFMSMLVGATPMRGVADRWVARALALAEGDSRRENLIYVLQRTSCYDVAMGRWDRALEKSRRARALASEIGDRRGFGESHMTIIQALNAQGRLGEGLATAKACIEDADGAGDREMMAEALVLSMDAHVRAGAATAAIAAYERALPDMAMHGEGIQAYFHAVAGEARLQAGDRAGARTLLETAAALLRQTPPASYFALPTLVSGAQVAVGLHIQTGDPALLVLADQVTGHLVSLGRMYPYVTPARDRMLAELARRRGRQGRAASLYAAAIASADRLGMTVERAEARLGLAGLVMDQPRHELTGTARALFAEAGAVAWKCALTLYRPP